MENKTNCNWCSNMNMTFDECHCEANMSDDEKKKFFDNGGYDAINCENCPHYVK